MSPEIDTSDYGAVKIEFDHYNSYAYGTWTMELETSPDGTSWTTVWSNYGRVQPAEHVTIVTGENVGSDTFHVSFTVKTESYSILYWYVDNLEISGYPLMESEYSDVICIEELGAGVERQLNFNDWTPDFLQYETSGQKSYKVTVHCDLEDPLDRNGANDAYNIFLTLDYFHDPGIREVTSPYDNPSDRVFYATDTSSGYKMIWFDPDDPGTYNNIGNWPSGTGFPQGATFDNYQYMWFCDTYGKIFKKEDPMSADYIEVGPSGLSELLALAFHEKTKTMYGMSSKNLYTIDMDNGDATLVGSMGNSGLMISMDCNDDGIMYSYELDFSSGDAYTIDLETGRATKLGETGVSLNFGQDMAYDWDEDTMYVCAFNYGTFAPELHTMDMETGDFTKVARLSGSQTTAFAVPGGGLGCDVYIPCSTQSIIALAENIGTFPERDMTCNMNLYEYITDCENGTLLKTETITNIDILTPLVGTKSLDFGTYNFATEGFYATFFELFDDDDDNEDNNQHACGIGVDCTPPVSSHTIDPPNPDGDAGWYVSQPDVTLSAVDPGIGCDFEGSGVQKIEYRVNGAGGSLPGEGGTFTITAPGNDILIEYWAVDWVGNQETKKSFMVDLDLNLPVIAVRYDAELLDGKWWVTFTAEATDDMSGMEKVVMFINEGFHEEVVSSGPVYEFTIEWSESFRTVDFRFEAKDIAGWTDDEVIPGSGIESVPYLKTENLVKQKTQELPK
jgi:hypothetical protein